MSGIVSDKLMEILNGVLLGLYGIIVLFGCFRLIMAVVRSRKFLVKFFSLVLIIAILELSIQTYQLVELLKDN